MQLVQDKKFKYFLVLKIIVPQFCVIMLHQSIIKHLEVCQYNIWRCFYYLVSIFNDIMLPHGNRIFLFTILTFSNEKTSRYLSSKTLILIDSLSKTLSLVTCQRIHRIKYNCFNTFCMFMILSPLVAIIKKRKQETFSFTGTCSCSQKSWLWRMIAFGCQSLKRLILMLIKSITRNNVHYIRAIAIGRSKWCFQRNIWFMRNTILVILYKRIKSIIHLLVFEVECCFQIFNNGIFSLICLL